MQQRFQLPQPIKVASANKTLENCIHNLRSQWLKVIKVCVNRDTTKNLTLSTAVMGALRLRLPNFSQWCTYILWFLSKERNVLCSVDICYRCIEMSEMIEFLMKRNDVTSSSTITSDKLFNCNLLSLFRYYLQEKKSNEKKIPGRLFNESQTLRA